ncbi:MAG: hypothetical protein ACSHW0_05170 [Thalassotalea sp.]
MTKILGLLCGILLLGILPFFVRASVPNIGLSEFDKIKQNEIQYRSDVDDVLITNVISKRIIQKRHFEANEFRFTVYLKYSRTDPNPMLTLSIFFYEDTEGKRFTSEYTCTYTFKVPQPQKLKDGSEARASLKGKCDDVPLNARDYYYNLTEYEGNRPYLQGQ